MTEQEQQRQPGEHEHHRRGMTNGRRDVTEPRGEVIDRGQLYFLSHPTDPDIFSGYGLTLWPGRRDLLAGLLMVDRSQPVDPEWLKQIESIFGEYRLTPMTATGERGMACQMRIEPDSVSHLRQYATEKASAIQQALLPLLENPPKPSFQLRWDETQRLWMSEMIPPLALPSELREVFERVGPACIPIETDLGVVHVCHAADQDIAGFANKPVVYQWQLALLPTAPVLRLRFVILDQLLNPYKTETFLNVGQEHDRSVLETLFTQESLYLAFYGQDFTHHYTKVIDHNETQREGLHRLADQAVDYWRNLPETRRDFDQAKVEFQRRFPL